MERTYRHTLTKREDWTSFSVQYKESDLWVHADRDVREQARSALYEARAGIEGYGRLHPEFFSAYSPLAYDPDAPEPVRRMLAAARTAGVGPMAAVAGTIAQWVGESALAIGREVAVENGGDIYLNMKTCFIIGIYAGSSPLSDRIGIRIDPLETPMGVGTSSATVGHSWSYGKADAACVLADNASLADAAATALGNRAKDESVLEREWVLGLDGSSDWKA